MASEYVLELKEITKIFPGVKALDKVSFQLKAGEIHALMGENGAGKSTLMKVLTGIYTKDSGTITYEGKDIEFHNTREAQDAGIVIFANRILVSYISHTVWMRSRSSQTALQLCVMVLM